MAAKASPQRLGPWSGVYQPDYQLHAYSNGDPSTPIRGVDWRSVTSIQTSKNIGSVTGTFTITLKHARAQTHVSPMDVIKIQLRGHNQGFGTVLVGVVDYAGPSEQASATGATQDTIISGRCTGKYLQINSMFLPVWDPQANLPTALTFGIGDASSKLGTNISASTPREIFGYIFDNFVVGKRGRVGLSGTPNARFWMNRTHRFEWVKATNGQSFRLPFVQFDEDTCDTALTRLVIQGFSEGWVDEIGNIVYRPPGWDLPTQWLLHSSGLVADTLQTSDIGRAAYVEVFPGAFPGVSSGQAQAMLAGRAPIPSDYVTGLQKAGFKSVASKEFIIDVNSDGTPTSTGQKNWYYQQQKKYGLRPYQITSPLLATREDAQAQAEGLLRQLNRLTKSGTITIPGEPGVGLGQTLQLTGNLRGHKINRSFYIEGVSHEYVEGDHYTTTLTVTHGRDPWDPHWVDVALPQFSPAELAQEGGIVTPATSSSHNASFTTPGSFTGPPNSRGVINPIPGWTVSQLDFGVDCDGPHEGAPVYAPAACTIVQVIPSFNSGSWGTQGLVLYRFDSPLPGAPSQYWYASEGLSFASTTIGTRFAQGAPVATFHQGGTGVEIGWGCASSAASYRLGQLKLGAGSDHLGAGGDGPQNVYGNSFKSYFGIS